MVNIMASVKSAGTAVIINGWNAFEERIKMKIFVEIALIWGIVLAFIDKEHEKQQYSEPEFNRL